MPVPTTRARVSKPRKRVPAPAAVAKRKSVRKPRTSGTPAQTGDALLVALFAQALGETPRRSASGKRRSLAQALDATRTPALPVNAIDAMPGARLGATPASRDFGAQAARPAPPCVDTHRRNRMRAHLIGAGSWCLAMAVTALIVGTAAASLLAHAPHARQTIAAAIPTQF